MSDQSQMSMLPILDSSISATSSRGSADGALPCASPDGLMTDKSGPDHRHASRSAQQGSGPVKTTSDTSPPIFSIWSGPAAPECCLASRSPARQCSERLQSRLEATLSARLNGRGSTMYRIVWKQHTTPLGRSISRQRASAHRTSGNAPTLRDLLLSGWATAQARDHFPAHSEEYIAAKKAQGHGMANLNDQAQLACWPTAASADALRMPSQDFTTPNLTLNHAAVLAGYPSPTVGNATGSQSMANMSPTGRRADGSKGTVSLPGIVKLTVPHRFTASGQMLTGSEAGMESGGQLNPEHSRWLMGFPAAWGSCGATAMRSIRGKRPSSSKA